MRPNIILLTTGSANSTVCVRMLGELGWHLGDIDPKYAEHRGVAKINRSWPFDAGAAVATLESIPQPWAVKDPKWSSRLGDWRPLLKPYRPLLLWITKDLAYTRQSVVRRFNMKPEIIDKRQEQCQARFDNWPWAKLQLDVEQIASAVKLFDPLRAFAHRQL